VSLPVISCAEALDRIGSGRRIIASPGCGAPTTLLEAIGSDPDRIQGSHLFSGLLLGDYPFLDAVGEGTIGYGTWHVMPPVRRLVTDGTVDFYPVRGSQVPALLRHLDVDVALVRVAPPDRHGWCNLGPSTSYPLTAIAASKLVVAELDESVPRARGEAAIHVSRIDFAVESTSAMPEYRRAESDAMSKAIAKHIVGLLPDRPILQIGIGSISEAFVDELLDARVGGLRFAGMGVDGIADLHDAGLLDVDGLHPYPPVLAAELMGSRRLMDFAHENPSLGMFGTPIGINAQTLGGLDRFVSVNSALEVDIHGQVSSEVVGGKQISGVGGSVDFVDAAMHSAGGCRVIAMAATNVRDSSSKLVRSLAEGVPVTIPRHAVDCVVTEHGVARLAHASARERLEQLAAVAAPAHRDELLGRSAVA